LKPAKNNAGISGSWYVMIPAENGLVRKSLKSLFNWKKEKSLLQMIVDHQRNGATVPSSAILWLDFQLNLIHFPQRSFSKIKKLALM
jgi:hypothetical protein